MDQRYPELCPIFNGITTKELAAEVNETFTVAQFFESFDLSDEELFQFKHQLMEYATDNLVKINAFMDSPYQIIVADAADAVSVNFSGRCKFLQI